MKKIRKQVDREDGQLLILPSDKEEVGALSDPTVNLSAANIANPSETAKESEEKDRQHYASLGLSEPRGEREQRAANERFNNELTRYQNGEMDKNEMLHLGRPQGVMRAFLPNLPIVMRQRILTKGSVKKHNVAVEALVDMPNHLSHPIFVFKRSDNVLGVLTEMQDRDGKNVCVAIELNRQIQNGGEILEVNDIRSVHGRNVADIVYPIVQNGTLKWVDKEKGLTYLSSASQYVRQEIDKQDLDTATKVVKYFVNPKESEGKDRQRYASSSLSEPRGEEAAEREATSVRLQKADIVDAEAMAEEYGLDADDVRRYAEGMRKGSSAQAARALAEISRKIIAAHEDEIHSLLDMRKFRKPVEKALKEAFGDVDVLIEERRKQIEEERNTMEAARKRAEEEQRKREARLEELAVLTDEEIDHSYAEALAKGDVAAAREMLDEAARRKGYGDVRSDYQGVGAWRAPSKPDYETDEARRNAVDKDSPNLNVEDMAAGYSNQPEDIFVHPNKYSQGLPTSKESGNAIQTAIDDIRNGKKDVTVKVYRAVPTSVKEGKLRNGDWVTPSRKYAELHGSSRLEGKYRIIEDEVPVSELWWDGNDVNEWGCDNGKGYRYKNVKNNRKLNDLVTRDDNGNVIPPSKRFNQRKADERFQRVVGGVKPSKAEAVLRDAVIDRLRENGMEVITDVAEGQKVLDEANGKGKFQMGDAPETFAERLKLAVENRGVVMPWLNETYVEVVKDIPRHGYVGTIAEATKQAIQKAKEKYTSNGKAKVLHYDNNGVEFDYVISGNAIEICLSPKHQAKSGNKGVHLALAEHLDEVINKSVEVEEHPDYIKGKDGKRGEDINPDALMHRFYGVAVIDGVPCRVMTLMREEKSSATSNGIHSYEVQKIEVLDNDLPSTSNGVGSIPQVKSGSLYPLAKLLKGVEKSYDKS